MKKFAVILALLCAIAAGGLVPQTAVAEVASNPLVLGTYELDRDKPVIDGDTIKVWGLKEGIRLLCVDTEETFKKFEDRKAAGENFDQYLKDQRGDAKLPVKCGTFMGEEAAHFAREFFKGIKEVRLEYDTVDRKKGFYGRHLCFVYATPKGEKEEKNFCLELVREGYSPYSMKYGHSVRFRKQFEQAQKEARENKRGIWRDKPLGYRDYDERLKWWGERGDQIDKFRKDYADTENAFEVGNADSEQWLNDHVGKEVVLFAGLGERNSVFPNAEPARCELSINMYAGVNVHFENAQLFESCNPEELMGYFVLVRGTLQRDGREWLIVLDAKDDFQKYEVK